MADNTTSDTAAAIQAANDTANTAAGSTKAGDGTVLDGSKLADEVGKEVSKSDKPDGLTPEIQKYIDSQSAAARRAGELKGKTTKEQEIEAAKVEAQKAADLEAGKHKDLYDGEVTSHTATKSELNTTKSELNKLKAALASQVPNPLDNYKRIVGDDYDAMIEDAKSLALSFGNNAHRDVNIPPIIPNGGDGGRFEQNNKSSNQVTTDDIARNRGKYGAF